MTDRANLLLFCLAACTVTACLFLGGGTRAGFMSDVVIEVIAIPLLLCALWNISDVGAGRPARWAATFCLAIALVPLLQLVPLPPGVWTALPHRDAVTAAFELIGRDLPWVPLSVSPGATWLSALSLLPPLAVFLGTLSLDHRERRRLSLIVLASGLLGVLVGLMQVAQGPSSALRFFEFTNPTEAVGFFANRNHFAALLYSLALLAAAWAVDASFAFSAARRRKNDPAGPFARLVAALSALVILVAAAVMARSRAGLTLTIVSLLGAFALGVADRRGASELRPSRIILGATALAVIFAAQFGAYRALDRFASDPLTDARLTFARVTIDAAKAYMPFGSGLGTFVPVYATFETSADALVDSYANRAHNDVLELWLETGVVGLVLEALFAAWFLRRTIGIWRRPCPGTGGIDRAMARAATLIIALLAAHSLVDYPLRTSAMAAVFAFACALLIEPPARAGRAGRSRHSRMAAEHQPHRSVPCRVPASTQVDPSLGPAPVAGFTASAAPGAIRQRGALWGADVAWPAEWQGSPRPPPNEVDT